MTISYPIYPPAGGFTDVSFRRMTKTTNAIGTFNFAGDQQDFGGRAWAFDAAIAPQSHEDGQRWESFFGKLDGFTGTFLFGDPSRVAPSGGLTNLFAYSSEFNSWTASDVTVTPNATTDPDATSLADAVIENTDTDTHYVGQTIYVTAGHWYTFSASVKANGRNYGMINVSDAFFGTGAGVYFDLSTPQIQVGGPGATGTITSEGSGWYRVSITTRAIKTGSTSFQLMVFSTFASFSDYTGDGVSGLYFYGAQMEFGKSLSSRQAISGLGLQINGAAQSGNSLDLKNGPVSEKGWMLEGDFIQISTGSSAKLYQLLSDLDTDGSGNATVDIWPKLLATPSDSERVYVSSPSGLFRCPSHSVQTVGNSKLIIFSGMQDL